jgi:hypothetical protein
VEYKRLSDYAHDVTSQNGEDGMLSELFARLEICGGWCAELGAWDGKYLSNTWSLWHDREWSAVLIEGDTGRADALVAATEDLDRVHVIEAYAGMGAESSLDRLFARTPMPETFELLSIDIDGDDFHLWSGLDRFHPKVVVVEYNATFPPEVKYVQQVGDNVGSSAAALVALGERKGYCLAGLTQTNLIFVDRQEIVKLGDLRTGLADLFDRSRLPVVYSDLSGHHYVLEPGPWGYSAASRAGADGVIPQFREAAKVARRSARQVKRQLALRAPGLASIVKAGRDRIVSSEAQARG